MAFRPRRAVVRVTMLGALIACALLYPTAAAADVAVVKDDAYELGVRNNDGTWYIAKDCFGSRVFGTDSNNVPLSTGPGYIERLVDNAGRVLIDDWRKPIRTGVGVDSHGGFGSFSYHHARGIPPFVFKDMGGDGNVWATGSRICEYDMAGYGVARGYVTEGPTKYGGGADSPLYWSINVEFRTPYKDPSLRVVYRYQFHLSTVKVWTHVQNFCGDAYCGDWTGEKHFAKEPKFNAETNLSARFNRACVYDSANNVLARWSGSEPPRWGTSQVHGDDRARARFDFGGYNACSAAYCPCLNAVGRSYPAGAEPTQATYRWEDGTRGLDGWAYNANYYSEQAHWDDSPAGDADWGCHGGSPATSLNRSWEQVGWLGGYYEGVYYDAFPFSNYFLGWKGGTGTSDCEPLSRTMTGWSQFSNHMQFSVDAGWSLQ